MSTAEESSSEQEDTSSSETEVTSRVQYSKVLPLKCHIFMLYGSFAAVLPNTSVEAEQLGISPQLVGAMMAAVPFSTVLAAVSLPYFRSRVATIKRAMILVTLGQGTCHLLAMRVTRGHRRALVDLTVRMQCFSAENASTSSPLTVCLDNPLKRQPNLCPQDSTVDPGSRSQEDDSDSQAVECTFKCGCFWDQHSDYASEEFSPPANKCLVSDHRLLHCGESYCVVVSKETHLAILCDEESTPPCRMRCHERRLRRGERTAALTNWSDVLRSLRKAVVWSYLLLRLLAIVFSGVAVTLTDAAAHLVQDADEPPHLLLQAASTDPNRLWGSAGWGAASLLAGQLNHWKGPEGGAFINFAPGVYLSAGMNAVDVVAIMLLRMPLREVPYRRLFESEPSAYRKRRTYFYMALAYVVGSLSGAIWVFGPLRLRLLGAVPQLLAATTAVQVFGGELVHTFASERIVQLLGLRNAASASILSLFARLLAYGLVPLPWALLPVEVAQGLSVGLYSRTTLALAIGDPPQGKTERHLQQVLSTIYHGLGACFGAFVAGCLIPVMEINRTFVLYSVVALVAFYVQFSFSLFCSKRDSADGGRRRRTMVTFFRRSLRSESSAST